MPKRKTHEQFMNELSKVNINIEVLGTYVNTYTKLQCRCLIDGYKWNISPHDLLAGFGCPKYGGTLKKTHDDFKSELEQINPNIVLLNKYIDMKHKVKCKCLIDGNEWESLPQNLLKGTGCPVCSNSHGEKAISTVLDSMFIEYIPQHRFNDCRNTRSLPFDFYLPHFNMCIEYDGQQHFRPVNFGGCTDEQAIKSFESTKLNDSIKNQYCKNNNIRLLRISYCDYDNIGTIIQNIF